MPDLFARRMRAGACGGWPTAHLAAGVARCAACPNSEVAVLATVPDTESRMKRWGHVLSGVDPWGGWTFVEKGSVQERCSTCHWVDPELVNTHVPSEGHLSEVVREVMSHEVVSAFDVTLVFGAVFRDRLLRLGVAETVFRDLPGGFVTFDYLALPTVPFRESAEGVELCAACGRRRVVKREYGPNRSSYVVDDPGDEVLVRDLQRTGRGRLRGWSVFMSDPAYAELGWPRHSWDVFVDSGG